MSQGNTDYLSKLNKLTLLQREWNENIYPYPFDKSEIESKSRWIFSFNKRKTIQSPYNQLQLFIDDNDVCKQYAIALKLKKSFPDWFISYASGYPEDEIKNLQNEYPDHQNVYDALIQAVSIIKFVDTKYHDGVPEIQDDILFKYFHYLEGDVYCIRSFVRKFSTFDIFQILNIEKLILGNTISLDAITDAELASLYRVDLLLVYDVREYLNDKLLVFKDDEDRSNDKIQEFGLLVSRETLDLINEIITYDEENFLYFVTRNGFNNWLKSYLSSRSNEYAVNKKKLNSVSKASEAELVNLMNFVEKINDKAREIKSKSTAISKLKQTYFKNYYYIENLSIQQLKLFIDGLIKAPIVVARENNPNLQYEEMIAKSKTQCSKPKKCWFPKFFKIKSWKKATK